MFDQENQRPPGARSRGGRRMKATVTVWADRTIQGMRQIVGPLGKDAMVIGPGNYRGTIYDYYRGLGYEIKERTRYEVVRDRVVLPDEVSS